MPAVHCPLGTSSAHPKSKMKAISHPSQQRHFSITHWKGFLHLRLSLSRCWCQCFRMCGSGNLVTYLLIRCHVYSACFCTGQFIVHLVDPYSGTIFVGGLALGGVVLWFCVPGGHGGFSVGRANKSMPTWQGEYSRLGDGLAERECDHHSLALIHI